MRKKHLWCFAALAFLSTILYLWWPTPESRLHEGDIVMRGTGPGVAALTFSKWTHCGVLAKEDGEWVVYEANQSVRKTPLPEWKYRHHVPYIFRVLRMKEPLSDEQQQALFGYVKKQMGRSYDNAYRWSDEKQYCSELVWKAYHAAGIELSAPRCADTFLAFDLLPQKKVDAIMKQRGILPKEPMVPPCDLANSSLLKRVW